ncbi:MAG: TetR/AcrR family transcriptional regulator [Chloroflexota bacterium]|nr:MAG: TetR/AcrR family transcriptional regulator [Chloroflexota bacterium]
MSPRPKKNQQTINLQEAIKDTAWKQIAEYGAPALSLRGLARVLGITAPAIYNYYPDRDALVTALIVDAFTSLGESQKTSIQDLPPGDHTARLTALGLNYREWAMAYPQRYLMIFGTPIPGYHAPEDITVPAATWALQPLIATLQAIFEDGSLRVDRSALMTPDLASMLASWSQFAGGPNVEVLYAALIIWSRVHGLVTMEIGGQMPSFITDPGEVFRREIENIKIQYLNINPRNGKTLY